MATCCSKACPGWPRPSPCAPSPIRSRRSSCAFSSPPTCYPPREEEKQIMDRMAGELAPRAQKVITPEQIAKARAVMHSIYVDDKVKEYILNVVFATREPAKYGLKDLSDFIEYGASPRATLFLNLAARAHAFLRHRGFVTPEDVKAIGFDGL